MTSPSAKRKLSGDSAALPPAKAARALDSLAPDAPSSNSGQSVPVLHAVAPLPEELWCLTVSFLITGSPFLPRADAPAPHFPVTDSLRTLVRLSRVCSMLHGIVAQLLQREEYRAFREQASLTCYESGHNRELARQQAQASYAIDPVPALRAPELQKLQARDAQEWELCCRKLTAHASAVRELRLELHADCLAQASDLERILPACGALHTLALTSKASLPWLLYTAPLPALRCLKWRAASLPEDWFTRLAKAPFAARLESLDLAIDDLPSAQFEALRQAAPHLPRLSLLTLRQGLSSISHYQALSAALPDLRLQRLDLGKTQGIDGQGAQILADRLVAHPTLTRLALNKSSDAGSIDPVLQTLLSWKQLQEFCFTGPLRQEGVNAVCALLKSGAGLRRLALKACQLSESQMQALAQAVMACPTLAELRLVQQAFTDAGAHSMAAAIRTHAALRRLDLHNCPMNVTPQAYKLGRAISASNSLLAVELRLGRIRGKEKTRVAKIFADAVAGSNSVVHFEVHGAGDAPVAAGLDRARRNWLGKLAGPDELE